jgi:hypothetical protein
MQSDAPQPHPAGKNSVGGAPTLAATRYSLHVVAELVLAGPQRRTSGTINLTCSPGGFRTIAEPAIRVEGTRVVHGGRSAEIDGSTPRALGEAIGVEAREPGNYHDGTGAGVDEPLVVARKDAEALGEWFAAGKEALLGLAPDQTPVLWPEHFDQAITAAEVNYGVSPGDAFSEVPYAYVGPWQQRDGDFWNAPFGAFRTWTEVPSPGQLLQFFREGRDRAAAPIRG